MNPPPAVEAAIKRLSGALDHLEAAAERRAAADARRSDLEEELSVMQDDRSRLAVELDGALARSKSLELAQNEVTRRVDRASAEIEAILTDAGALDGE